MIRLGAICLVASLLAGCGGGSGTSPADGNSPSSSATTAGQPMDGQQSNSLNRTEPVAVTVGGTGNVTSSTAGIDCAGPGECVKSFPVDSTVTLDAAPAAGETFVGWTGACSGTARSCVITVRSTENVGANFAPAAQMESLQVTIGGAGAVASSPVGINCSGAGSCTQPFDRGTTVTLAAVAATGNAFVGWTGACSGSATNCTVSMTAAQSVGASFAPIVQSDSLQVTVGGSGAVTSSPAGINCSGASGCSHSFANGTQVTLSATPASGNSFSGWTGACSGSTATCTVTLDKATQTVGATFAAIVKSDLLQVAVGGSGTVTSSPAGISCSGGATGCSQSFVNGTSVTLTAAPRSGYAFSGWSGSCSGSSASCTVTLSAASQSVGASFASTVPYFALQVTNNGNGTVTSSPAGISCTGSAGCSQSYTSGTVVALTAVAASGYVFSGWSGACSGSSTCAVTMSAAQNVGATFAASAAPPPTAGQYLSSSSYPLTGPQPYKFLVTAPNGPIPASLQPYEVWPMLDGSNQPYFSLDVSAAGPWGAWTNAQMQAMTVTAVDQTGWVLSTTVGVTLP